MDKLLVGRCCRFGGGGGFGCLGGFRGLGRFGRPGGGWDGGIGFQELVEVRFVSRDGLVLEFEPERSGGVFVTEVQAVQAEPLAKRHGVIFEKNESTAAPLCEP